MKIILSIFAFVIAQHLTGWATESGVTPNADVVLKIEVDEKGAPGTIEVLASTDPTYLEFAKLHVRNMVFQEQHRKRSVIFPFVFEGAVLVIVEFDDVGNGRPQRPRVVSSKLPADYKGDFEQEAINAVMKMQIPKGRKKQSMRVPLMFKPEPPNEGEANKAPEPTPTAVTPRATKSYSK